MFLRQPNGVGGDALALRAGLATGVPLSGSCPRRCRRRGGKRLRANRRRRRNSSSRTHRYLYRRWRRRGLRALGSPVRALSPLSRYSLVASRAAQSGDRARQGVRARHQVPPCVNLPSQRRSAVHFPPGSDISRPVAGTGSNWDGGSSAAVQSPARPVRTSGWIRGPSRGGGGGKLLQAGHGTAQVGDDDAAAHHQPDGKNFH